MSKKRTLDAFFSGSSKKHRPDAKEPEQIEATQHTAYPFPVLELPLAVSRELSSWPAVPGRAINDQADLDLLYFEPYIPIYVAKDLFQFLRSQLPFYRVEYKIKRGGLETQIRTPRYTTVFGLDETSRFHPENRSIVDSQTGTPVPVNAYARYAPRPIPKCLDGLRRSTEAATGCQFNFCLVNYYASGADSISFHSDDERFLGPDPAIASFSLGARRDFYLKHKPVGGSEFKQVKLPLGSGDMVLMRGRTQANWLHSIPKRSGKNEYDGGRINITFRRAMVRGGTDNYYNYNVGTGPVYKWDREAQEMKPWKP